MEAIKYVIERGLADAEWLFGDLYDTNALREEWVATGGRKTKLPAFCGYVDAKSEGLDDIETGWFSKPSDIIKRTRTLIAAIYVIEDMRDKKRRGNPRNIENVAKVAETTAKELRHAISLLFIVANPSYEMLLDLCGVKTDVPNPSHEMAGAYEVGIDEVLLTSLYKNAMPTDEEAEEFGYDNFEDLKQDVRKFLLKDLHAIIDHFTSNGWNISFDTLNQNSVYFREYGIGIYYMWFDDISDVCAHENPKVAATLGSIFNEHAHINRYERDVSLYTVPDKLIQELSHMGYGDRQKAISIIENHFGLEFEGNIRRIFNTRSALKILRFWQEHNIPFKPYASWFALGAEALKIRLDKMAEKCELLNELGAPFKTRVQILSSSKMTPGVIRKHMESFEKYGLHPDYYAPYLSSTIAYYTSQALRYMFTTVCAERVMTQSGGAPRKKNVLRSAIGRSTPDRIPALEYLAREGYPYDSTFDNPNLSPENYAMRVRLFVEAGVPIHKVSTLGDLRFDTIKDIIPKMRDTGRCKSLDRIDFDKDKYERMIEERELTPPDYFKNFPNNFNPVRIMQGISLIESKGLLFTRQNLEAGVVYWSWINLGPKELERQIYKRWAILHKEDKWREICETYGIDIDKLQVGVKNKTPDGAWGYMRLLCMADIDFSAIEQRHINLLGPERFRDYLYKLLKEHELTTDRQRLFCRKYELAEQANEQNGWKDAHSLFDLLSNEELPELEDVIGKVGERADDYYKFLRQRRDAWDEVRKRLLRSQARYSHIDDLLDNVPITELQRKIAIFDEAKVPIDMNIFDLSDEEIKLILYGDTENDIIDIEE